LLVSKKYLVSKVIDVPNSDFIPAPKVDSSVLFFEKHGLYEEVENDKFMNLIKI
jgi:16S rRNA A1518/A1519 N6-dimethyltransferase RsmA/KsgA/DIM1 with predicted DNA glycosylase/AP lyase activity